MANRREQFPNPYDFLPQVAELQLSSDDLIDGETMSLVCAHESAGGQNLSPSLRWSGFPAETAAFAITCFDPDAPSCSGWWHWQVIDIPVSVTEIPTGAGTPGAFAWPEPARMLTNDFPALGYGGAAPPPGHGPHRYIFTVHALPMAQLPLPAEVSAAKVSSTINRNDIARGHIIAPFERS